MAPTVRPSFPSLFAPQRRAREERFAGSEPEASFFADDDGGVPSAPDAKGMGGSAVERWNGDRDDLRFASPAGSSVSSPGAFPDAADTPSSGIPSSASPTLLPLLTPSERERSPGLPASVAVEPSSHPSFEKEGKESIDPAGNPYAAEMKGEGRKEETGTVGKPGETRDEGRRAAQRPEPGRLRDERDVAGGRPERPVPQGIGRPVERRWSGETNASDSVERGETEPRGEERSERNERTKGGRGEEETGRRAKVEYARPVREPVGFDPFPAGDDAGEEGREGRSAFGAEAERRSGSPRQNERTLLVPQHRPDMSRDERLSAPSAPAGPGGEEGVSTRTVNVTIGRIEVRGAPQRPSPPVPARQSSPTPERSSAISLTEYLKRYNGRGG